MTKRNVIDFAGRDDLIDGLTELLRTGAGQLIQQAVEVELSEFMEAYKTRQLDNGRAAVVRNGHQPARNIQTGIGPVKVQIPKVRAKDGHPVTFRSVLAPPYVRKTRSLGVAISWLYLKFDQCATRFEAKYPKATQTLQKDREEPLAFYDFPVLHRQSLRTSNPIESTFGTIRHQTRRSKGCLSCDGMLHMVFTLGQCAQTKWRRLRGFKSLSRVISDIQLKGGIEVNTDNQVAA